jgi:hypothetical protein
MLRSLSAVHMLYLGSLLVRAPLTRLRGQQSPSFCTGSNERSIKHGMAATVRRQSYHDPKRGTVRSGSCSMQQRPRNSTTGSALWASCSKGSIRLVMNDKAAFSGFACSYAITCHQRAMTRVEVALATLRSATHIRGPAYRRGYRCAIFANVARRCVPHHGLHTGVANRTATCDTSARHHQARGPGHLADAQQREVADAQRKPPCRIW